MLPPLLPLLTPRQQRWQHERSCLAWPLQLRPRGEQQSPLHPLLPSRLLSTALSFVVPWSLVLPCPGPLALAVLATLAALTALAALAALAALTALALALALALLQYSLVHS